MANLFNELRKATTNAIKTTIADFDFEKEMGDMRKSMINASKRLGKEIKRIQKHIHNYFDKWIVDVNFNQDEDIIQSQIKDGVITIKVTKEITGAETTFSTTIPKNVIVDSLVQKYNPETKKAIFEFTKMDEEIEETFPNSVNLEETSSEFSNVD